MKKWFLISFALAVAVTMIAQDSTGRSKKFTVSGYVKNLQTLTFDKTFRDLVSGNLIHNRINIKWKPSVKIMAVAEFRNRLFWGEEVKSNPVFATLLRNANEKIDMQKTWIRNKSLVLHSNTERLYVDYRRKAWNLRVGRQRINWGITATWNPNDIFNTYNFLDFDYEERPGADGAKFQYNFGNIFNAELAYVNTGKKNGNIAALKYSLNKWNYDLQFITGWYNNHPTWGAGWAGYVKDAGFKGEFQYFVGGKDSVDHFNISLESDYMFKGGWYLDVGFLFNKSGLHKSVQDWNNINLNFSPENLMPTKWNFMLGFAKEITPLLSVNLNLLYAPGTNFVILLPSFQYNIATNLDMNFVWQSFFAQQGNSFESMQHRCYLRMKWSF